MDTWLAGVILFASSFAVNAAATYLVAVRLRRYPTISTGGITVNVLSPDTDPHRNPRVCQTCRRPVE